MTEDRKEIPQEEMSLNFFIKSVRVIADLGYDNEHDEYDKLYITIKGNGVEMNYNIALEDYTVEGILKAIGKFYNLYQSTNNQKLIEGAKEEILKLITLLIWALR
jgi:hypothetical protein